MIFNSSQIFSLRVIALTVLGGVMLLSTNAHAQYADKYSTCLDYWSVGPSGCGPKKKDKQNVPAPAPHVSVSQVVPQQAPVQVQKAVTQTLDEKIDDFLENHGKPPREFVAFHLEPTLENALKWVQTYREMLSRNQQIVYAWEQAEKLYEGALSSNDESVKEKLAQLNKLPEIPDFGVEIPGFERPKSLDEEQILAVEQVEERYTPQFDNSITARSNAASLGGGQYGGGISVEGKALDTTRVGAVTSAPIKIDYYFSAQCPFCQRFEPDFQRLIAGAGSKVDVTCIDMTPSGASIENINGDVDCTWRPIEFGEAERMGIKRTPSLIIDRGNGGPLERLSGYVDPVQLKAHLALP